VLIARIELYSRELLARRAGGAGRIVVGDDQFGEGTAGCDAGDGATDPACSDEKYAHVS